MDKYKSIKIYEEDYQKLLALANANGRKIVGQLHIILANVDVLPHPADATPVPVVMVKAAE